MKLHEIPTPALVVDIAAMERNIARMAGFFAVAGCKVRPHFKAHKTPAIARRQLAAGSCTGLTCAPVGEAEGVVAERRTDELLIPHEVVGPGQAAHGKRRTGAGSRTCSRSAHVVSARRTSTTRRGIAPSPTRPSPSAGANKRGTK